MSYQPLARKYRPSTFEELVGQDGVAKALANSIRLGREPHAVIFSGVRGIGKTTTARLYAKALNCELGPTPEPCGTCQSCQAIVDGRHEDVLEIDGASNTGVDDVRALRETVSYVPQRSKYKVYIIDEVHMLSQSAFNALLKTLEEPPIHVVFVFATTELQRIPQTIISRCQTFYLQRFTPATVVARLRVILEKEGIPYEDKALDLVAREGRGSMRDSLTFLDQAIALGDGSVTVESLSVLIANVSSCTYLPLLEAVLKKDAAAALEEVSKLDQEGREFRAVVEETAKLVRHAFVVKDIGSEALDIALLDIDQNEVEQIAAIVKTAAPFDLNRIFRTLVKCRADMDGSALDRFIFENYLLEWCFDPGFPTIDALRNSQLPHGQVSQGTAKPRANAVTNVNAAPDKRVSLAPGKRLLDQTRERRVPDREPRPVDALATESYQSQAPAQSKVFPESWRALVDLWKKAKPIQARIVEEAYLVEYSPSIIHIAVPRGSLSADKLLDPTTQKGVAKVLHDMFGFSGAFNVTLKDEARAGAQNAATESLLDIKNREKIEKKQAILEKARQSPVTKSVMAAFNADIETIIVE